MKKLKLYRDSIGGMFVTKEYAEQNPETTQAETVLVDDGEFEKAETIETEVEDKEQ